MLVLVSFGLVLLATILLVVGLLSDDGINLIYLSIGASATAAVVLFLAFRLAKPKTGGESDAPTPLADDIEPDDAEADATAVTPVVAPVTAAAPPVAAPAPPPPSAPEPVVATEDDWADDTDWEVDAVEFPIADYDDLNVSEIMPLLPQLYSDELDLVYEREANGKNRMTVLSELDKLKVTGTEADALELGDEAIADPEPVVPEPEVRAETVAAPAPEAAPVAASPMGLLGDDFEDDGAFFPIADYDDLSVSQITPLLSQLELDELEDVKAREQAGADRKTLIAEIDRYLSGELEAFTWDDAADDATEEEAEADQPEPAAPVDPEAARLPIAGYPGLNVPDVVAQLDGLTPAQLEQVLAYESARDNRVGVVGEINSRLESAPVPVITRRPRPGATKKVPAKQAAKRATKKRTATKSTATKATAKKSTAKKARKSTKKATRARFPIANYDELNVADIRPRLTDLSDNQLRQVRAREAAGAGRKTILDDIANRLS